VVQYPLVSQFAWRLTCCKLDAHQIIAYSYKIALLARFSGTALKFILFQKTAKEKTVKILKAALIVLVIITVSACGSAERKKNKAEARNTDEKTKTMQEYKSCIKKAKDDQAKLDLCENLLKANE